MASKKPKGLGGRGLDGLLGPDAPAIDALGKARPEGAPAALPVQKLRANKYQPRTQFDEGELNSLADSIRVHGVIQPLLVRPLDGAPGQYEIIDGERRYRAAQLAGLKDVPVLTREASDKDTAEIALIQNMLREGLNPLEEAQGVRRLLDEFSQTHEQVAQAIGRSRSAISNLLRLLNLAAPVQTMLLAGDIDMGHARALLAVDTASQILLANQVAAKGLSVRETEKLVTRTQKQAEGAAPRGKKPAGGAARDLARLEEALSDQLGTRVSLKIGAREKGQLVIDFHGWEHLNSLLERQGLSGALDA
jgi:ParB family chromosome partitioning protein